MKKIFLILLIFAFFGFVGCTGQDGAPGRDGQDGQNGIISEVFELRNVNFGNTGNGYQIFQNLTPNIFASDVILIYRLSGTINNNTPIWQPIPRTLFLQEGELDYDFDFSKQDFTIYARATYALSLTPQYITNQTFRIVLVPGAFSDRLRANVSYNELIARYNINDSVVRVLN